MLATQWPRKEAIMYLRSESTHRGNPLVSAHACQPQLVGARAKDRVGKKCWHPAGWSTLLSMFWGPAKASVDAAENCRHRTNNILGNLRRKAKEKASRYSLPPYSCFESK